MKIILWPDQADESLAHKRVVATCGAWERGEGGVVEQWRGERIRKGREEIDGKSRYMQ
jgi:hypothetical protein